MPESAENEQQRVSIGRFGTPFGVKGWVKVQSFTDPVSNILDYPRWQVATAASWQTLEVIAIKAHDSVYVAELSGFTDRDAAARLTNREIAILRDELPSLPDDEFYWHDLEGMRVVTAHDQLLGHVDYLFATGSNDIMVIEGTDKRHLVPFLDHVILQVDKAKQQIQVAWDPEF